MLAGDRMAIGLKEAEVNEEDDSEVISTKKNILGLNTVEQTCIVW